MGYIEDTVSNIDLTNTTPVSIGENKVMFLDGYKSGKKHFNNKVPIVEFRGY